MNEEDFITKFYSCDNEEQFLKDVNHNLNCLQKVQNNWNELKKFVEDDIRHWEEQEKEWIKLGFMKFGGEANTKHIFRRVLNKMQELEGNNEKVN